MQTTPKQIVKPPARGGFTLLELLLVLALVAALASLAIPAMGVLLADSRIKRAGDEIRIVLAGARLKAMRSGRTQVFRCEIGTGNYSIQPWHDASDMTEAADMTGKTAVGAAGTQAAIYTPPEPTPAEIEQLPEEIVFTEELVEASQRSFFMMQQAQVEPEAGWSQPILLYADGTASTAIVRVKSPDGSVIKIQLRGLTGEAIVSEVITNEQ